MGKIAIISTHPIQYYAPVFSLLAKTLNLKVFYTLGSTDLNQFDQGFGKKIQWDIPLMEGYDYEFLSNIAKTPGSHHFTGIDNPNGIEKIQNFEPDAILIYGWAYKSHLKLIRHFSGKIPIYFRGDSTVLNQPKGIKSIFKRAYLSWLYKHIDKAFYVGQANKAYFKHYGLREDQLIFAPHAIDNERFTRDRSTETIQLRNNFKIPDEAILILFAGKFELVKNPELLLNAFLNLKADHIHLLFVGNGVLEGKLKAESEKVGAESGKVKAESRKLKAESEKLKAESEKRKAESLSFEYTQDDKEAHKMSTSRRIHFLDFQNQSQMPVVYQACDLFCLPSWSESWGLAVNEAMAAGKAVLVSDQVGCAADLVQDEYNGAIFKSGNEKDLTDKLVSLCKDKLLLKKYGKCSAEIINKWSFEKQVALMATELEKNATSK